MADLLGFPKQMLLNLWQLANEKVNRSIKMVQDSKNSTKEKAQVPKNLLYNIVLQLINQTLQVKFWKIVYPKPKRRKEEPN